MQYCEGKESGHWLDFYNPLTVIQADRPEQVVDALKQADDALNAGRAIAGFIAYEAASGLDRAFKTKAPPEGPVLKLGVYGKYEVHDQLPLSDAPYRVGTWTPDLSQDDYRAALQQIKKWIATGDTYQVNYTLRLATEFSGHPEAWFKALYEAQRPQYAAYIDDGDDLYCSASPELFFRLDRERITTRPMKGTSARGLTWEQDVGKAEALHQSEKNRAENLMIVDMMRNDLGRIARTGTISAEPLFSVERYPTVLQMTSTITGDTDASLSGIFRALFPSCSITGAPKVRTMELIRDLEKQPRGIYTGSLGFALPNHPLRRTAGRFAQFNVAIRTAHIKRSTQCATYGTGGGIVWDSDPETEYRECLTKALILRAPPTSFDLLETLCWKPGIGLCLLDAHLDRMAQSAAYFGRPFDRDHVVTTLKDATANLQGSRHRVRLTYSIDGTCGVTIAPLTERRTTWRVGFDTQPVDATQCWLYHKTTHRTIYDEARARHPGCDDVILWNEHGHITESSYANVVACLEGQWYTPPIHCGLLGGTLRGELVRRGRLKERKLTRQDLLHADRWGLINSVRGFIHVVLEAPG